MNAYNHYQKNMYKENRTMKSTCLRCKFFKIEDRVSGYCKVQIRETGVDNASRPLVMHDHSCDRWTDCGQQYYIRLGWLRSQEKQEKGIPH